MRHLKTFCCCLLAIALGTAAQAQIGVGRGLNRISNAANRAANRIIDKKVDDAVDSAFNNNNNASAPGSTRSKNSPTNKGGGLVTTPPNVNENLGEAEAAFKKGSYGEARSAVQQAMLGVEMEIGHTLLRSLPETVAGLKKDTTSDEVTSSSWGWTGLTIRREYGNDDKQFNLTISNNAAFMQAVNMYLSNPAAYGQSSSDKQKLKQTRVKDKSGETYKAVIEYEDRTGYKLSVPLGQTSLLMFEGINIGSEQDMMAAAAQIDITAIKKQLGEN